MCAGRRIPQTHDFINATVQVDKKPEVPVEGQTFGAPHEPLSRAGSA